MQILERVEVESEVVGCDGGGGVGGHPLVYLNIGREGAIICPYCSREFVLRRDSKSPPAH